MKGVFNMKPINYRDGLLQFNLPDEWMEDYDESGVGYFYEDRDGSGTVSLNLITFETEKEMNPDAAVEALKNKAGIEDHPDPETLPNGNALLRYEKTIQEDEDEYYEVYWEIANPVAPHHLRLAIFVFTVLEEQKNDDDVKLTIEMLNHEIPAAVFAKDLEFERDE
jgi:hypothetical protein